MTCMQKFRSFWGKIIDLGRVMLELNTLIDNLHFSENLTFPLIIFTHFDSPDQLPGFGLGGTLTINSLIVIIHKLLN